MEASSSVPRPRLTYLVERYWPGVTVDAFTDAAKRVRASVEQMQNEGERILEVSSTLVPEDEAAYWVLEAPSARLVELAFSRAAVPIERILVAVEVSAAVRTAGDRQRKVTNTATEGVARRRER